MKAVMPVRRAIGVRSILHVLGPLLNPAGARRQVMGVYQPRLVPLAAEALTLLGAHHAMVVHGDGNGASSPGGMDELALSGPSQVAEVRDGRVTEYTVAPEDFGLARAPLSALAGGDAATNATMLTRIFAGEPGPPRDVVLLNTAAVLVTAGFARTIGDGVALAAAAIDSGATARLVTALRNA
jgi:anthranilate phosphoribosyltransferase